MTQRSPIPAPPARAETTGALPGRPAERAVAPGAAQAASFVVFILAGVWLASQIQRMALAAYLGASSIMPDLGLTAPGAGLLSAVYFPVYGAMQVPSGVLADQADPRRNILLGGVLMVLASLAFAAAPNGTAALVARVAVGVTSGLFWLSSLKLCWCLPGGSYARRLNMLMGVGAAGSILGLAALPLLLAMLHWRIVSVLVALPVAVMALLLSRVDAGYRAPAVAPVELLRRCLGAYRPVAGIVRRAVFWKIACAQMLMVGTNFAVLTWMPRYAHDVLQLPAAAVGVLPALLPAGQIGGNLIFGYVYARRTDLGLPLFFGCTAAYLAGIALLATGLTAQLGLPALYTLALGMGVVYGCIFISLAWVAELFEPALLGTASGVLNGLGFVPAFALPWVMGACMDAIDRPSAPGWAYSPAAYGVAFAAAAAALAAGLLASGLIALALRRISASRPASARPGTPRS
jgi:MFS family permease